MVLQNSLRRAKMNLSIFQLACLPVIFSAVSGTPGCDPDTGPAGLTHCFLQTPDYTEHQYATCLSDAYIRQKSRGRHECRNRTSAYCYYHCMLERHNLDKGPVYDDCLCYASRTQPSLILPTVCYYPTGTDCSWYRRCLAKMFNCSGSRAEYAISFGEKMCSLYTNGTLRFSRKALRWINVTRKCLQVALVPALRFDPAAKPTCEDVQRMAFDTHFPCYVAPQRNFSVCDLPLADWVRVFWTIKGAFLPPTFVETSKAAVEVLVYCGIVRSRQLANNMYSFDVHLQETIGPQTPGHVLSNDELAHAVVLDISSSLRWSKESTVDWYAFAVNTGDFRQLPPTMPGSDQARSELIIQVIAANRSHDKVGK